MMFVRFIFQLVFFVHTFTATSARTPWLDSYKCMMQN